ncbi:MAG: hypothetical protein AAGA80_01370 [Cyanobacteria bacterium P01_F01_bin.143]
MTADSLHSDWVKFEAASSWITDKLTIQILGPGLTKDDLPSLLKSLPSIPIDAQNAEDGLNKMINKLAKSLNLQQKITQRRKDTLQEFSDALRAWQSKRQAPDQLKKMEVKEFKYQIEEIKAACQKEKQELKATIEELNQFISLLIRELQQKLSSKTIASKKIIKIFLASSSELKDDRKEFEIFINYKNKEFIRKDIFLELVMWEDVIDAMSQTRLQDEYNKAITKGDIFISLFHEKVGQSTTEEFLRALTTFNFNKKLPIYTYFKESLIRPSEAIQMRSIFGFQDKLRKLGHFYNVYENIDELKYLFDQQLNKSISELTNI